MEDSKFCCIFCGNKETRFERSSWCCWIFGYRMEKEEFGRFTVKNHVEKSVACSCCFPCVIHYNQFQTDVVKERRWFYPLCCLSHTVHDFGFQQNVTTESCCYTSRATISGQPKASVAPEEKAPQANALYAYKEAAPPST